MPKINLKKLRFIPLITKIHRDYDLTYQQSAIYGYLFNHCMNINEDGYCGYSDNKMADDLQISYERFRKELAVLKSKELILIRNPQKRTKKTGESRMIYINTEVFIDEVQLDMKDIELERLKEENKELKEKINQLLKNQPNLEVYVLPLLKKGIIEEKDYKAVIDYIAPLYYSFAIKEPWGSMAKLEAHINHLSIYKQGTIDNPIAYLTTAFERYKYKCQQQYNED